LTKVKTSESIALSYGWFEAEFLPKIIEGLSIFWEADFEAKLVSISNYDTVKKDKMSLGETYFAKPVKLNAHQNAIFRLNAAFVRTVLHSTLGSSNPTFQLSDMSELEVKILNSFLDFMQKQVCEVFLPYDEIPKSALKNRDEYNLTFAIQKEGVSSAKFVITLPQNVLEPDYLPDERGVENKISDDFFTFVALKAGTTKLALSDLKLLSAGDIVLLEQSNINRMYVKSGTLLKEFKISPDPGLMIDLNEEEHDVNNIGGAIVPKNMWDDIQIEVSAEFEKVKMTLGELKQITNGMVIDLADAFNSKISLVVEDKVVARGDLVIINDRYGVRLDEIIQDDPPGNDPVPAQKAAVAPKAAAAEAPKVAPEVPQEESEEEHEDEEDFDYSDFEDEE